MPVKLFSGILLLVRAVRDAFELEINNWSASHPDLVILNMDVHMTEQNGELSVLLFLLYTFVPQPNENHLVDN